MKVTSIRFQHVDASLRTMINELQDTQLLVRIVGGDLITMDAKCHQKCLTNLRNQYCSHMRQLHQATVNIDDVMNKSREHFLNSLVTLKCLLMPDSPLQIIWVTLTVHELFWGVGHRKDYQQNQIEGTVTWTWWAEHRSNIQRGNERHDKRCSEKSWLFWRCPES